MVFQPMLPEVVGGSLSPRHVVNPIRQLCDDADVLKGDVRSVDLHERTLQLDGGYFSPCVTIRFDHLVFATGSVVDLSRIPGMAEHAFLMRNAGDAMKLRAAIIARMEEANLLHDAAARRTLLSFVVVGGGHSGVETAGQMIDLIRGVCRFYDLVRPEEPCVTLIHSRERLLPTLDAELSAYTRRKMERNGVKVILNRKVRATTARSVLLDDGTRLEAVTVVCTVGNAPHPLVTGLARHGGLPVESGKIVVSASGKVMGGDRLWAAGDCALFPKANGGFCPETAQFAMRQGAHVAENIAASFIGHPLEAFTFTWQGELAVIGHRSAVASVMGVNFSGFIAWFFWRTLYLLKLPGLDRKLRVVAEWTMDLFFPRDINLLTPRYSSPLEEMHLEPGDPLFHAGEPAFSFYAVKSGRVDIVDREGQVVKSACRGDHFGERALLEDRVWHFDAIAREATELVAIEARTFDKMVGCMEVLERLFTRSAKQYAMPAGKSDRGSHAGGSGPRHRTAARGRAWRARRGHHDARRGHAAGGCDDQRGARPLPGAAAQPVSRARCLRARAGRAAAEGALRLAGAAPARKRPHAARGAAQPAAAGEAGHHRRGHPRRPDPPWSDESRRDWRGGDARRHREPLRSCQAVIPRDSGAP